MKNSKASKVVIYQYARIMTKTNLFNLNGTIVKVKNLGNGTYCAEMASIRNQVPDQAKDFFQHLPEENLSILTTQELTEYLSNRFNF